MRFKDKVKMKDRSVINNTTELYRDGIFHSTAGSVE